MCLLWAAFWRNLPRHSLRMGVKQKMRLFDRAVLPVACYRMRRWPYQSTLAKCWDGVQNNMVVILLNVRRVP